MKSNGVLHGREQKLRMSMDWLGLLAVQGTLKSLLQYHSSKASILQCSTFFIVQLSHLYMTTGKTIALLLLCPYHFCPLSSPSLHEMSLGSSNFLEEISSLSHPIIFLYFFALITEEGFLISPCYSLALHSDGYIFPFLLRL